jgi:hypothetical protein
LPASLLPETAAEPDPVPQPITLSGPYPNPFRSSTTISLVVSKPEYVRVYVTNELGHTVRYLQDGLLVADRPTTLTLFGSGLSSGVYFIRIVGEHFEEARKVVRVK